MDVIVDFTDTYAMWGVRISLAIETKFRLCQILFVSGLERWC